jgi:hypothetical protein
MEVILDNEMLELVGEINRLMDERDNNICISEQVNIQTSIRLLHDDLVMCVCQQIQKQFLH